MPGSSSPQYPCRVSQHSTTQPRTAPARRSTARPRSPAAPLPCRAQDAPQGRVQGARRGRHGAGHQPHQPLPPHHGRGGRLHPHVEPARQARPGGAGSAAGLLSGAARGPRAAGDARAGCADPSSRHAAPRRRPQVLQRLRQPSAVTSLQLINDTNLASAGADGAPRRRPLQLAPPCTARALPHAAPLHPAAARLARCCRPAAASAPKLRRRRRRPSPQAWPPCGTSGGPTRRSRRSGWTTRP